MAGGKVTHSLRLTAALAAATCLAAGAKAAPLPMATNLPNVVSFAGPPIGFDAVHASDADLDAYGFPPRPALAGDGRARHDWERMIGHARFRINPQLRTAPWRAGPQQRRTLVRHGASTSTNWAGLTITNLATTFGLGSFALVVGEFNVPFAQQAFSTCSNNWDYSAAWVGMDGINNNSVLQAGTESDAYCAGTYTQQSYYAWVEWYPADATEITNMPVSAGDIMGVYVYAKGPTTGLAVLINATTNQYVSMGITAPAGTTLQGSSVEWIMERPSLANNQLTTLTNFVASYMSSMNAAELFAPNFYAGLPPAYTYSSNTTMTDNAGRPLATATLLGAGAMQFQDTGSAY